jgi:hypothetical protein
MDQCAWPSVGAVKVCVAVVWLTTVTVAGSRRGGWSTARSRTAAENHARTMRAEPDGTTLERTNHGGVLIDKVTVPTAFAVALGVVEPARRRNDE